MSVAPIRILSGEVQYVLAALQASSAQDDLAAEYPSRRSSGSSTGSADTSDGTGTSGIDVVAAATDGSAQFIPEHRLIPLFQRVLDDLDYDDGECHPSPFHSSHEKQNKTKQKKKSTSQTTTRTPTEDLAHVPPLQYLAPFLVLLQSERSSSSVTNVALGSLGKLAALVLRPDAPGLCEAAAAVAFALADTSLCVVGSHLAAHEPHYAARNSQYAEIVRDLRLGHPAADILNQFDHVVWCGDLNYRVTLPVAESLPYIRARQYAALLAHDQLTRARREKHAFVDFAEGRITFAPTYKLARSVYTTSATAPAPAPASGTTSPSPTRSSSSGSGSGNTNSGGSSRHAQAEGGYVTKRNPSWCDRVLWKSSLAATPLTPAVYTSSGALTSSDHCPVHAVLRTHVLLPPAPGPRVPLTLSFKGALTAADLAWPACCAAATDTAPTVTLTFLAPFLDPTRVHAVSGKPRSASPAWAEGEIPDLPTCVCDPVYLAHRALTVVFSVVCPRFEATFGRAVIPLGNGAASHPPTTDGVRFTTRITLRGRPVGKLSGTVCIFPTPSDDSCP